MKPEVAYIALGGNEGDVIANFKRALKGLGDVLRVNAVSSLYETKPLGIKEQANFINAAFSATTTLDPFKLLKRLKLEEKFLGRLPRKERWGPRPIDLDLLFYGNKIVRSEELVVPHPAVFERDFFIVPLLEIASDEKLKNELKNALDNIILRGETFIIQKLEDLSWREFVTSLLMGL